jgi:hypothetical protein
VSGPVELNRLLEAGRAVAGLVSPNVASLQGELKAMLFMKVKASVFVLAVVGLALSGGLLTHHLLAAKRSPAKPAPPMPPPARRPGRGRAKALSSQGGPLGARARHDRPSPRRRRKKAARGRPARPSQRSQPS